MNSRLAMGIALALLLLTGASESAWAEGEGYIQFVSANPINYEGQMAWEYYYDVYSGGLGSASQIWFHGFDANELLNPLNQRWCSSAAAGYHFSWDDFPSYRNSNGNNEWVLSGQPGEMLNPIHAPDDYLTDEEIEWAFLYSGDITAEDELHYWYGSIAQYVTGLYMTVRLVHPDGPGDISYSIIGPFYWEQQNAIITGPVASGTVCIDGDLDCDDEIDADDVDLLCANMGGDPAVYDMDGDGDVDEDDMVFLVENYLEYDSDGDSIPDGAGTFRGDFNLDGTVNGTDLSIMSASFGTTTGFAGGNANCDTTVNGTDLSILSSTFGNVATAAIPEPTTLLIIAVGGLVALKRRKA
jgi:hypothetical protein